MKQYTNETQISKLIELGFEKPKSISGYYQRGPYEYDAETNTKMVVYDDTQYPIYAYSIGELIEMLPMIIGKDYGYTLSIYMDGARWIVAYDNSDEYTTLYSITRDELVDALFDMVVKTKEEE